MSIYIHIPFCISKCAYCDFFSKADYGKNIPDSYIDALCNEISFRFSQYDIKNTETVYVGGGTPSLLSGKQIQKIFDKIKKSSVLKPDAEISFEVNPDDINKELLENLGAAGVNRISCGIQTMNDKALKAACRRADEKTNQKALELLSSHWKKELSIDLISGLPYDNEETIKNNLDQVCSVNPDHISFYSLTIEEETPFGKKLNSGELSYDFDFADKLWLYGRDYLEEKGYGWYEVSNFSKPGKECRHNLRYWNHQDYLGCGSGASGTIYFENGEGIRWTNTRNIKEYTDFWTDASNTKKGLPQNSEKIDFETSEFEFFMMGLRKLKGIKEKDFIRIFDKDLPEKFLQLFEKWEGKGLCVRRGSESAGFDYAMSREGILFLNRFLEELF